MADFTADKIIEQCNDFAAMKNDNFLIETFDSKVDELNLKTVMVTESSDQSIAKTIVNNTTAKNQQILVLDSVQSVTLSGTGKDMTYLSIMENNLNILKEALK